MSMELVQLDFTDTFPQRRWGPANRPVHRGVERDPPSLDVHLWVNVAVDMRLVGAKTGQCDSHRMAGGEKHRTEQDRHVVAIPGTQFEHPPGGVQQLDPENVARIT